MCQTGSSISPPTTHHPRTFFDRGIRASRSISRQAQANAAIVARFHSSRAGTSGSQFSGTNDSAAKGV